MSERGSVVEDLKRMQPEIQRFVSDLLWLEWNAIANALEKRAEQYEREDHDPHAQAVDAPEALRRAAELLRRGELP